MINIINVGTGALGALYSSRLAIDKRVNVYNICRSNYKVVKQNGFIIQSKEFGNYNYQPKEVFQSIEEAINSNIQFDYCLITMKALPDHYNLPEMIKGLINFKTNIILIQNGIYIEQPYKNLYPNNLLISIVANVAVTQTNDGIIKDVTTSILSLGVYPPVEQPTQPSFLLFKELLDIGKVNNTIIPDINIMRWNKLVWNASFSPICILTNGCHTLNIHNDKEAEDLVFRTMKEVWNLAIKVIGKPFPDWVPGHSVEFYLSRSYGLAYKPSLLIDFERKKPLELEVTLGHLVNKAKEIGFEVPLCSTFYTLLKLADKKNRDLI